MKNNTLLRGASRLAPKSRAWMLLGLLAGSLPAAHAEQTASSAATFTVNYTLIDLDLNDGITPSYLTNPLWTQATILGTENPGTPIAYNLSNNGATPLSHVAVLGADRLASSVAGDLHAPGGVTLSTSSLTSDADADLGARAASASKSSC